MIRGDQAFLCDLGSTNGTFLNEQRVQNEMELKNGDQLKIESLLFRVNLETGTPIKGVTALAPMSQPAAAKEEVGRQSVNRTDQKESDSQTVKF